MFNSVKSVVIAAAIAISAMVAVTPPNADAFSGWLLVDSQLIGSGGNQEWVCTYEKDGYTRRVTYPLGQGCPYFL